MYSHGKVQVISKFLEHPFTWSVNQDTSKLQYRDLTGPEKLLEIENIGIEQLLPTYNGAEKLPCIWKNFLFLYTNMRKTFYTIEERYEFSQSVHNWLKDFLSIYQTKDITLYIHAFYCHVPHFLKLNG